MKLNEIKTLDQLIVELMKNNYILFYIEYMNNILYKQIIMFIIMTLIKKNLNNIFIPVIVGIVTIILYKNYLYL